MYVLVLFLLQLQLSFGIDVECNSSSSSAWARFFSSTEAQGDGHGVWRPPSLACLRASLVRSCLAWLHELQQMYRMMASAGVVIPALSGGTPGIHAHGFLLSPSGHRAEVTPSWTEWSRTEWSPRGHRPSGQEQERSGRSMWSEETRSDPDWYPQGRKRRITQV